MSARLIGELANWLLTPEAADLTPQERLVLFVVAERAHERTRIMLRHRGDEQQLVDRIAQATGLARDGALKKAFQRLAKRGLDVRIPVAEGKDGRPVFAHEGHSMRFRLPEFPASVTIPERPSGPVDDAPDPVESAVDNPASQDQHEEQRGEGASPLSTRGGKERPASQAQRREGASRPTPSNYLDPSYEQDPSTWLLSHVADVEAAGPILIAVDEKNDLYSDDDTTRYTAAQRILGRLPDFGGTLMAQAQAEMPNADTPQIVVRAAQIAARGIPA